MQNSVTCQSCSKCNWIDFKVFGKFNQHESFSDQTYTVELPSKGQVISMKIKKSHRFSCDELEKYALKFKWCENFDYIQIEVTPEHAQNIRNQIGSIRGGSSSWFNPELIG